MQVEIFGGAVVTSGSTVSLSAGNSIWFEITNIETGNCGNLRIQDVDISNTTDFDIYPNNPSDRIKPAHCNGDHDLFFRIDNLNSTCGTFSTDVTIEIRNQADFTFTVEVDSSPEIYVFGADFPFGDIFHGDTTTSADNNTYFGVVDEGNTVTRTIALANIGSCYLDFGPADPAWTSSNPDFTISSPFGTTWDDLDPNYYIWINITFTAPVAGTGTQSSVISVNNTDNTTFTFTVSAEMFNENIPGPGGVTADFRLWLKSTRGVEKTGSTLNDWIDLGSNGKDATTDTGKEPTYLDTATDNINFNPVVQFENDGLGTEQYLYNSSNGFYSQDIFIIAIPDVTMDNSSSRETIFAGVDSGSAGDETGIGFGNYSSEFTNEILSYNQDIPGGGDYNGEAEISTSKSYSKAGIINVRNNAATSPTGQDILYNSDLLTTSSVNDNAFANVGYIDTVPDPDVVIGTEYWIGRNFDVVGSFNGRIAEIFTFAERLADADRQKVESYLAIKYGITLGSGDEAEKDYINSFGKKVWDETANSGYNYDVAGIGRDSISDLNQKQSKSVNYATSVAIGLGGIKSTNNLNASEFSQDGDFLVWGNDDGAFTGTSTNTITVDTGITTSLTRIDRKWKIVETNETGGDVSTIFISIPEAAFSSFTKLSTEEYSLIVADNANFANGDIIDVIPLRSDGAGSLYTWYNFDATKYFTFGKAAQLAEDHSMSFASGDFLVGEFELNLTDDAFTISAWVKTSSNASTRTLMSKGEKLVIRLNSSDEIEVMIDDTSTPKYTSDITIGDGKWHQLTFVWDDSSLFLYFDGVLDKSVQNVLHPSPNSNHFALGSLYIDKDNISNPFLGEIDDVYVWDLALDQEQIRYLMNQEIERFDDSGTDYVSGKVLPQASTSNLVSTIPWSELRVYYDFNSFYGSTVEGLTDDRFFLRIKQLDKDKTILEDQTIPVPYVSAANGAWDTGATWSNNADQIIPNTATLDGTIVDWNIVETEHDITSGDRDIDLLGLKNISGTLTIADPVDDQDETNTGQGLTVTNYLEIDGVIDLVGESQLIQTEGSIIDSDSGGFLERDQQGTANAFNYNYWSSSVGPITGDDSTRGTGIAYSNPGHALDSILKDGTTSSSFENITFNPSFAAADSDTPSSPITISSFWLYKFNGDNDAYSSWTSLDEDSIISAGEGFTMKGSSGTADILTEFQNYVFKGLPNNGDITLPIDNSVTEVSRLIGNPYPSAMDATEFILDNMAVANGGYNTVGNIFNGAIYFWDHFGEQNSHYTSDYIGGYATRNLLTGTVGTSNNGGSSGSKVPGQFIPVNQGFIVTTELDGEDDNNGDPITTVTGGDIIFNNGQRIYEKESPGTSIFIRSSNNENQTSQNSNSNQAPIIRLAYDSPSGFYRQIAIGINENTSNGFDFGYDAPINYVNQEDMYWMFNNSKFVIQGVQNFDSNQEFSLGLLVNEAGLVTIRIDALENIDDNIDLYLKDNLTSTYHDLRNSDFELGLNAGEYHSRFSLVFQNQSLSVNEELLTLNDIIIYMDNYKSEIHIKNNGVAKISNVEVHNILGQQIKVWDIKHVPSVIQLPVNFNTGAYIITVKTDLGNINKKLIIE